MYKKKKYINICICVDVTKSGDLSDKEKKNVGLHYKKNDSIPSWSLWRELGKYKNFRGRIKKFKI